jgi:UDP-N-acetylmuramate dehydrogenase
MKIQEDVTLNKLTSINLGGKAKYYIECNSTQEIKQAIEFTRKKQLPLWILGGGSNTVFLDEGFNGVVLKIEILGIDFSHKPSNSMYTFKVYNSEQEVFAKVGAGENWDKFVQTAIDKGYAGIECLSGIPGSVGATPIQNIGAYGQEVSETIDEVKAIDKTTGEEMSFTNKDCLFGYRTSRFKDQDADKYIITEVIFKLRTNGKPTTTHNQLLVKLKELPDLGAGPEALKKVRNIVLELRGSKSMVMDKDDPNTVSCGSFFVNPVITKTKFSQVVKKWHASGGRAEIPHHFYKNKMKIPAAWLIEQTGFKKGYTYKGVGLSENHCLALININGTTAELLELADKIKDSVKLKFGLELKMEPVVANNL